MSLTVTSRTQPQDEERTTVIDMVTDDVPAAAAFPAASRRNERPGPASRTVEPPGRHALP
jgi:hypothetical protein